MKILFVIVLLFLSIPALAQTDSLSEDILTATKFEEGLYRSYSSFRKNLPDVTTGFRIITDTGKFERYRLADSRGKLMNSFYGFSDGEDLYVSARIYSNEDYYVRISMLGPISYFIYAEGEKDAVKTHVRNIRPTWGPPGVAAVSKGNGTKPTDNPGWIIYLGDDDGQAYLFDQKNLLSIFKSANRPMYDRLKLEKDKYDVQMLKRYVDEFNKIPLKTE